MTDGPGEDAASPSKLRQGAFALLSGQWGKYLLQVLSFVVLARLLTPSDFGLVAMVTSVLGLATVLGDMGLSMAALQRASLSQGEKSNLFWLNLATGAVASTLAAAASPLLAAFYHRDEILWIGVSVATTFVVSSASVQSRVELNRAHRYRTLASIDFFAQLAAFFIAIAVALNGFGVWALVAQAVSAALVGSVWALCAARWRPSLWSNHDPVRPFLSFGVSTLALQAVNYVSSNLANIIIGRTMSASAVGIYGRATQLIALPVQQLASPLTRVALPYLARQSRGASGALTSAAESIQRLLVMTLVGSLSLLAAVADPLIPLLLGRDWAPTVPLVQIIAIGGAFQCLGYVYYWLFLSTAKTGALLISELPGRLALIILMLILWPLGLEALAWTFVFSQALIWLTGTLFYVSRTGVKARLLVKAATPTALVYAGAAVIAIGLHRLLGPASAWEALALTAGSWLAVVVVGTLTFRPCRLAATTTLRLIRKRGGAR